MSRLKTLSTLFTSTFKISAFTFGGGFVIIPLMRKKFVEDLKWIEEDELMDLAAIAQSTPGSIAVNASILIGYHVAGIPGALITILGTIIPPLTIITVISFFYQSFRSNLLIGYIMKGMTAAVAAVICDVVINLIKDLAAAKNIVNMLILISSFIAVRYLNVNILLIILVCAIIGSIQTMHFSRKVVLQ